MPERETLPRPSNVDDLEIRYDGTDWREVPEEAFSAMYEAIVKSVDGHLEWNVKAYGKAWTGEGEDTEFLCSGAAECATAALYDLGYRVARRA